MGAPTFGQTGGTGGGQIVIIGPSYPKEEVPTGTRPGTAFQTSIAYTGIWLFLNGIRQKQVVGTPGPGEFKYVSNNITTGITVTASDWLIAFCYNVVPSEEVPSGSRPGTVFTTTVPYTVQHLWLNGIRQKQVASGPVYGEYTYSGSTITTGITITASDWLTIDGVV